MSADQPPRDGPDFICIGLQKAATGWLYDQLRAHDGLWMPPIKELHYFDRAYPNLGNAEKVVRLRRQGVGALDARGRAFLDAAFAAYTEPVTRTRYAAMFAPAGDAITGDITPGYSTLPHPKVAMLATWFPRLKIVLLLRDPVERFWSAACMLWRRGELDREALDDPARLRALLALPRVAKRSFPTAIAARWRGAFGEDRFRTFFFDDIAGEPIAARERILAYLAPAHGEARIAADVNAKARRRKVAMTAATRDALAEAFADELARCRESFGGHAAAWCARYGV